MAISQSLISSHSSPMISLPGVPPSLAVASSGEQAFYATCLAVAPNGAEADRPKLSQRTTTEYPANGSSVSRIHTRGQRSLMRTILRLRDKYGQAARLISTSQLNASLRFHIWPINLVVYQEPLGARRLGRSHLVEGFTLRCLQRFSLPDVATRRCRWRDNRYTRGPSNPVLSY